MKPFNYLLYIFIFIFLPFSLFSQHIYTSKKYGYSVEIPKDYNIRKAVGEHIDLKAVKRNGNSVIIFIQKIPVEAKGITIDQVSKLTNADWENSLNEYVPNPKIIKKGKSKVSGIDAYYIHYTTGHENETKLYSIQYALFYKGNKYVLTFSCPEQSLDFNAPYFSRVVRSLKL